jgi:TM2 domain-containing membrane protein YozV
MEQTQMALFEAIQLNAEEVDRQEEDLRLRARELPEEARKRYFKQFKKEMKDPDTFAVLNWFFLSGLHHMYLGDFVRGAINLALMVWVVIMLVTPFWPVGVVIAFVILALELMALFRAQTVVANHNNQVAEEILDALE